MSHWRSAKLKLRCSLSVLQRALINIMPSWKDHIQIDANAGLTIRDMGNQTKGGYSIKVPKNAPGINYCDLGFKKEPDGSWSIEIDALGLPNEAKGDTGFENNITAEVAAMKARAIAKMRGNPLIADTREGNRRIIEIFAPVGQEYKIHA